jgi:hypothetical protein
MNTNEKPENGSRSGERNVVDHAKEAASEVAGQTKDKLDDVLRAQKDRATGSIDNVADALRKTGQALEQPGEYVERAAERIEQVGGYLREHSLRDIVQDVERFARREPAIFLGGAFTLGLLAARFLKSSSAHAHDGARFEPTFERRAREDEGPPRNRLIAGGAPRPSTFATRPESRLGNTLPGMPAPGATAQSGTAQRPEPPQARKAGASPTSEAPEGRNATNRS